MDTHASQRFAPRLVDQVQISGSLFRSHCASETRELAGKEGVLTTLCEMYINCRHCVTSFCQYVQKLASAVHQSIPIFVKILQSAWSYHSAAVLFCITIAASLHQNMKCRFAQTCRKTMAGLGLVLKASTGIFPHSQVEDLHPGTTPTILHRLNKLNKHNRPKSIYMVPIPAWWHFQLQLWRLSFIAWNPWTASGLHKPAMHVQQSLHTRRLTLQESLQGACPYCHTGSTRQAI